MAPDPVALAIHTCQTTLTRLARDHPQVTANMHAGTITHTNSATVDPGGAVVWTPVEAAANLRIQTQAGRYQILLEQAAALLAAADVIRQLNITANTTPLAQRDRCTGGTGDWADPTCQRLAVVNRWIDGTHHNLCYACDQRRYRTSRTVDP